MIEVRAVAPTGTRWRVQVDAAVVTLRRVGPLSPGVPRIVRRWNFYGATDRAMLAAKWAGAMLRDGVDPAALRLPVALMRGDEL